MLLYELFEAVPPQQVQPGQKKHLDVSDVVFLKHMAEKLNKRIYGAKVALYHWKLIKGATDKKYDSAQSDKGPIARLTKDLSSSEKKLEQLQAKITRLEKDTPTPHTKLQKLCEYISKNCTQYLKDVKESRTWMFRGVKSDLSAFVGHSRQERRAKDSVSELQTMFDRCLSALGATALRSNSIFATSNFGTASDYGDVYIIFPIDGKYTFTYTNMDDIVLQELADIIDNVGPWKKKVSKAIKASTKISDREKNLWLKRLSYCNHPRDVQDKISPLKGILTDQELEPVVSLTEFRKNFEPSTKNLAKAMKMESEVYINGQYIAIHSSFQPSVEDYFRGLKIYT